VLTVSSYRDMKRKALNREDGSRGLGCHGRVRHEHAVWQDTEKKSVTQFTVQET
jgi:hypothetical protein